ncbi:MAG TPA: di-heme oxidoredictase family protein [Steroidobacteraceae bacterium]|nr:di-heme oxidoredictase family protein [Steroidobacteraceae bacterium]
MAAQGESSRNAGNNLGQRVFSDARNPPAYAEVDTVEQARIDLGHAVFNTQWVPARTTNAARRDGLGPLFNASACDACHNEGAHGRGPSGDGAAPNALVIQLEVRPRGSDQKSSGDPLYGHTLNTAAIDGFNPEGVVTIHYRELDGRYPDGATWHLRAPRYVLTELQRGPLAARTIIQPRLAPALFGVGLLEAVPGPAARFGWQSESTSVRDQTTKAFARDMGLTTSDRPADDCTAAEPECLAAPNGGTPEVSAELLDAVVEFQRTLAVPQPPAVPAAARRAPGRLFDAVGCSACHRAVMPVVPSGVLGAKGAQTIAPYTDLSLHDLGLRLADRDAAGRVVPSRWRTAPLWGMAYRLELEQEPTFLHDGRARSIEEAILWHDGEAATARQRFVHLTPERRAQLLNWIGML